MFTKEGSSRAEALEVNGAEAKEVSVKLKKKMRMEQRRRTPRPSESRPRRAPSVDSHQGRPRYRRAPPVEFHRGRPRWKWQEKQTSRSRRVGSPSQDGCRPSPCLRFV